MIPIIPMGGGESQDEKEEMSLFSGVSYQQSESKGGEKGLWVFLLSGGVKQRE
jgi:hypothetical protein